MLGTPLHVAEAVIPVLGALCLNERCFEGAPEAPVLIVEAPVVLHALVGEGEHARLDDDTGDGDVVVVVVIVPLLGGRALFINDFSSCLCYFIFMKELTSESLGDDNAEEKEKDGLWHIGRDMRVANLVDTAIGHE